jgi:hypothetical protein
MKAKRIAAVLAVSICLTACGVNGSKTAAENNLADNLQDLPEKESETLADAGAEAVQPEEALPRELTEQEKEDYSAFLRRMDCYGFLLSSYEDVRKVNLNEVFYNGAGVDKQPEEEEIKAYLEAAGLEEVFTDLIAIPAADANAILLERTGYSLQDMQNAGNDLNMIYLDAYDTYFQQVGDTNYMRITCISGTENEDGTVTLECEAGEGEGDDYILEHQCTVTLDKETGHFISNEITGGYYADISSMETLFQPSDIQNYVTDIDTSAAAGYPLGDWSLITKENMYGTWYCPECGTVIVLSEEGAVLYEPDISFWGDELYEWEIEDRSERGLCPELDIYWNGRDWGPCAWYILGKEENYFWCSGEIFYKQ